MNTSASNKNTKGVSPLTLDFTNTYKSQKTVEKLVAKVATKVIVVRDGEKKEIEFREVVPGDIVSLAIGDIVPADVRLLEVHDLLADESLLTGESFPVEKIITPVNVPDENVQDLQNMLFMGTHITSGSCHGVVVATGKATILGKTAKHLKVSEAPSDFQKGISNFGKFLVRIILAMVLFIFVVKTWFGRDFLESLCLRLRRPWALLRNFCQLS